MFDFGSGLSLTKHTDALRSVKSLNTLISESRELFIQEEGASDIDGGWAYMIFATSVFGHLFVFGVPQSGTLLFTAILEYDFGASEAITSIPFAFIFSFVHLFSPLSNWSRTCFGSRITIFSGCFLSSIGLISASFVKKISQLIVTLGVMGGLGWALVYTVLVNHLEDYFVVHRKIVTMAVSVGTGMATFIYPFIVSALLERYGWRNALFLLGGLNLNLLACVAAFKRNIFTERLRSDEKKIEQRQYTSGSIFIKRSSTGTRSHEDSRTYNLLMRFQNNKELKQSRTLRHTLRTFLTEISCNNVRFQIIFLSHFFAATATSACLMQFSNYLTSLQYSESTIAILVSLYGLSNAFNRVFLSLLGYLFPWGICTMFQIAVFCYGIFSITLSFCTSLVPITTCTIFLGLTSAWFIMTPEMIFLTVGHLRFNKAFSVMLIACGAGNLFAPPFSGWIFDTTKSYPATFIAAGVISILGSVCNLPIWIKYTFC